MGATTLAPSSFETESFLRLRRLLDELFQFDQADLDFGIYRIMNQKRAEIGRFLDEDLLPQVRSTLADFRAGERDALQAVLDTLRASLRAAGVPPESAPRYRELQEQLATVSAGAEIENEVYSDLYTFFRRYYKEGDFISLRRYKAGVYAIPYEGEEVKLHWANADQYYVKTTEAFQDYRFRLPDDRHVHFRLVAAEIERDNNKVANSEERRFVLSGNEPVAEVAGELHIRFEYQPSKEKQLGLNTQAIATLLALPALREWREALATPQPTAGNGNRTLLAKHLTDYTAKNTFDYFIHKDLGGFLRRELDFFLKNEIAHLDDLDTPDERRAEQYLARLRAIKRIGHKIIDFLAQLENFQKRLFFKKKFVVASEYCLTLDLVPKVLYPEIAENAAQREDWKQVVTGKAAVLDSAQALTTEFLEANPRLVIDTKFFPPSFKETLLGEIDDLDQATDGVLIRGEGFQALRLLEERFGSQVKCIYIDPPFNLGDNADFPYKTNYQDSSWLSLLENRIRRALELLADDGLFFVRCDYHGSHLVRDLLESMGLFFKAEILLDRSRNEAGSANKMEVTYEHLFMYAKNDITIKKYTVPRSIANIKWTGFLMAGDRNPPERVFLNKTIMPPKGQHFSLRQEKVDKLLDEYHLRLKCRSCGALYYRATSTAELSRRMKGKSDRFKFYDVTVNTRFYGVEALDECLECGAEEFRVDYLGASEAFVSDNWLDVPSYSRRWGFATENAEELLERVVAFNDGPVLDFFAGSATTCAVAHKTGRKWLGVESGAYFDPVTLRRMKAAIAGESGGISNAKNWTGGGCFKHLVLESYEDALNNLRLRERPAAQQRLLEQSPSVREDYMLSYCLDAETDGSASLLDLERFETPFDYRLTVSQGGESRSVAVDLPETFNYLLGLRVRRVRTHDGFYTVEGTDPEGNLVLVVWRSLRDSETDNEALERFFAEQGYADRPAEEALDRIYVNGDNTLLNLRPEGASWQVLLIEEEFKRLMFADAGEGEL